MLHMNVDLIILTLLKRRALFYVVAAAASIRFHWLIPVVCLCAALDGGYRYNEAIQRRDIAPLMPGDVALVTGGSRGLGREIVLLLLEKRCTVIVLDIEPWSAEKHGEPQYVYCDLASVENTRRAVCEITHDLALQNKRISLLVNNAGTRHSGLFLDTDEDTLQRVFNVNTFSPAAISRCVVGRHVRGQGSLTVVNIASILATFGPCNLLAYSASKAACVQLHECFSEELRATAEILMLLVLPGQMSTSMFGDVEPSREFLAPIVDHRKLALQIVARVDKGLSGVLCVPVYANILPAMKAMPMAVQRLARWFSQMDEKIR